MATMKEIARLAGVSQATVSRVINGHETVHPELRARVMHWVHKLNYQPNANARSLVKNQSRLIGLLIPDVSNPFFSDIIQSVIQEADRHGYSVLIFDSSGNAQSEWRSISAFRGRRVEGVLLVPADAGAPHIASDLKKMDIPVVIMTQQVGGYDYVATDHGAGGRAVAKHLADLGHTRIAFIGSDKDPKFRGFEEGLQEQGLFFDRDLLIECHGWGHQVFHEAYQRMNDFLSARRGKFSAVFAFNDIAACGAMRAIDEQGLSIPGDVAVVGFDNTDLAAFTKPGLTSVAQAQAEIGRLAVELLFKKMAGEEEDADQAREIILDPRLVVRESTSPVAQVRS